MGDQIFPPDLTHIRRVFEAQKANQYRVAASTVAERRQKLQRLHDALIRHRTDFHRAMWADFRKPAEEVDLTEIYIVTSEIKHARANLGRWMAKQRVATPLSLLGASSWYRYEPKGVCLLISPWNYPLNLTFGPLVGALAAGNTVMIKPSEFTPHTSALMKKIVTELFEENEVALFEGAVDTATALLELPFNHIFFTGSPEVGKIVMRAAAQHLASVTLELGGKSPVIVDDTADIDTAAARIVWAKCSNNGQICIAPDYVFVHDSKKQELLDKMAARIRQYYGERVADSPDYMRLINSRHTERIRSYLEQSVAAGAKVVSGGAVDTEARFIEPTIVTDVPFDSDLMQKEIFGPVLPVLGFRELSDVTNYLQKQEKPLSLYLYSRSRKNIKFLMQGTRAGTSCINHNAVHFFNYHLPFGGSNNSGIGRGHGWFGFEAFSDARAVYEQVFPGALELLRPPYTNFKRRLIDFTLRWL